MFAAVRRKPLLCILLAAFLLRAGVAVAMQSRLDHVWKRDFLIEGDAIGYWELGRKLAAGEEFSLYSPPRQALRMPGFPAVLAFSMLIAGDCLLFARLLLAGVGTLACGFVYLLGTTLFDRRTGLWAAALIGISPVAVGFSVLILSETLFACCLTASLWGMAKLSRYQIEDSSNKSMTRWSLATGALIAVACYARPSWLLFAPLFVFANFFITRDKRRALLCGSLVLLTVFLGLLPWAARNRSLTGHWVFTTLWVGPSLYDSLGPQATGESDMEFFDADGLMSRMSEFDVDQHYRRAAWSAVAEDPGHAAKLSLIKLWRFWKPWPNAAQFSGILAKCAVALFFVPLLVLAGQGVRTSRGRPWSFFLTVGPILYFTVIHMVFLGSLRYRLPVEYPLCVMSAVGLGSWFPRK